MIICLKPSNKVQMICIQSSWCHCHFVISVFIKSRMVYISVAGLHRLSWKWTIKWVLLFWFLLTTIFHLLILYCPDAFHFNQPAVSKCTRCTQQWYVATELWTMFSDWVRSFLDCTYLHWFAAVNSIDNLLMVWWTPLCDRGQVTFGSG